MNHEPRLNWKQKTSRVVNADFAEWFIADQYQEWSGFDFCDHCEYGHDLGSKNGNCFL